MDEKVKDTELNYDPEMFRFQSSYIFSNQLYERKVMVDRVDYWLTIFVKAGDHVGKWAIRVNVVKFSTGFG